MHQGNIQDVHVLHVYYILCYIFMVVIQNVHLLTGQTY